MKSDNKRIRLLTLMGMFTALTTVATIVIQIAVPVTKGYINLGDTVVNISAWILGGMYGGAVAGIGSALADIITGYFAYAPATLIIKFLMAFVCCKVYNVCRKKLNSLASRIVSVIISELIMISGYALFAGILYGSAETALLSIPENAIQGIMGATFSVILFECIIKRVPALKQR
ncbi:MAG: ECF transporter S component [Muribaculaceae bacterium]|nr:ECF transporter S component [Alistipes senegalensis]MCM1473395.1 ECF transporter S component [Muribaculaceae bacterium]